MNIWWACTRQAAIRVGESPQDYLDLAELNMIKGNLEDAGKNIEEAERLGADPVQVVLTRSQLATFSEDNQQAESILESAIQTHPQNSELLAELSYIHFLLGQYDNSIRDAKAALEINPYDRYALIDMAFSLEAQGKSEEAIEAAEKAVFYLPKYDRGHYILGLAYMEAGRNEQAIQEFEKFLSLYWERPAMRGYKEKAQKYLDQLK